MPKTEGRTEYAQRRAKEQDNNQRHVVTARVRKSK